MWIGHKNAYFFNEKVSKMLQCRCSLIQWMQQNFKVKYQFESNKKIQKFNKADTQAVAIKFTV